MEGSVVCEGGEMESPYLADLEADDPELHNYASEHPEIVEKFTKLHTIWAADVRHTVIIRSATMIKHHPEIPEAPGPGQ